MVNRMRFAIGITLYNPSCENIEYFRKIGEINCLIQKIEEISYEKNY